MFFLRVGIVDDFLNVKRISRGGLNFMNTFVGLCLSQYSVVIQPDNCVLINILPFSECATKSGAVLLTVSP